MKADPAMKSTFRGMYIDFNEQFQKQKPLIRINRDSFSNVIDSSFEPAKQDFGRISTFREMMIDFNEHSEKHESSIRVNHDSLSNAIDVSV
jgi:hypothetical protein